MLTVQVLKATVSDVRVRRAITTYGDVTATTGVIVRITGEPNPIVHATETTNEISAVVGVFLIILSLGRVHKPL